MVENYTINNLIGLMRNVTICTFGKTQSHGNNLKWTNHVHHDIILNQSKTFTDIIYATKKSRVESPDEILVIRNLRNVFKKFVEALGYMET